MGQIQSSINQGIIAAAALAQLQGPTEAQQTRQLKGLQQNQARAEQRGDIKLASKIEDKIQDLAAGSRYKSINKYQKFVSPADPQEINEERWEMANALAQQQKTQAKKHKFDKDIIGAIYE